MLLLLFGFSLCCSLCSLCGGSPDVLMLVVDFRYQSTVPERQGRINLWKHAEIVYHIIMLL